MTLLPADKMDSKKPLPLVVAKLQRFKLHYLVEEGQHYFAVRDWLTALVDEAYALRRLRELREPDELFEQYPDDVRHKDHLAANGHTYAWEYVTDRLLYIITQDIRLTEKRRDEHPLLAEVQAYFARASAFADEVRRDPDRAIDAAMEAYRRQGKDEAWIATRMQSKVARAEFIRAFNTAFMGMLRGQHFREITNDTYVGLWERTAAQLREQLGLARSASLRDNQPRLALSYQTIVEEIVAQEIGSAEELKWEEAVRIVQRVANFIGVQAKSTSQMMGLDIATGQPLLKEGD
jgi:hypothetical protein